MTINNLPETQLPKDLGPLVWSAFNMVGLAYFRNEGEQERNPSYFPWGETVAVFNGRLFAGFVRNDKSSYSPFLELIASAVGKILVTPLLFSYFRKPLSLDRSYAVLSSCIECLGGVTKEQVRKALASYCEGSETKQMIVDETVALLVLLAGFYLRNRLEQKRNPLFNAFSHTVYQISYQIALVVVSRALLFCLPPRDLEKPRSHAIKWLASFSLLSPILYGLFERQKGLHPICLHRTSFSIIAIWIRHSDYSSTAAAKRGLVINWKSFSPFTGWPF